MRIKIPFNTPVLFKTQIPVRVCDINYGGHLGNDRILSIAQDARILFLKQWNYTELNAAGAGLIMADSAIQYKAESFLGDIIEVSISVDTISSISFDLFYKLSTDRDGKKIDIAFVKTGMIAFNYEKRCIMNIPEELKRHFSLRDSLADM
ncbi:MAG: acyl-CoA thioesterase [Bacteroidetes bacterium]|nr:acyl-CoA thioesterase [Bacteroidota bacterium]MBK8144957.1 acyl-CoA thioesterase [Bacteroidota bacterium]MBP6314962.1 acyl-CoA thioesterase [Chitinophagaceae bacterium]